MIRSVIVDDDENNITVLKALLRSACPQVQVCGEAADAEQAISVIRQRSPDLVFLDIEMPYGNAFDLLERVKPVDFEVILVTAFSEYSLKAFRYSVLDYLLKPVDLVELTAAVERANLKICSRYNSAVQGAKHQKYSTYDEMRIALPVKDGFDMVDVSDIVRCEAVNNCTSVFMKSKEKYVCTQTLTEYEELLPASAFFRVHRTHLLNLHYIRKYYNQGRGGYVELLDNTVVEVAWRRKDQFLKMLGRV